MIIRIYVVLTRDLVSFCISYCIGAVNSINSVISVSAFHFNIRLYDNFLHHFENRHIHNHLPQHFKHCPIDQIRIKLEWTLINQKRNAAEVDRDNNGDSDQSPHTKWTNLCKCSNLLPGFWLIFM